MEATRGLGPRSASTPALPPLSCPTPSGRGAAGKAGQAAQRQAFLEGLLNEDLQKLTKWHGSRPQHEQKRFLRSVNSLYKAFEAADDGTWTKQVKQNAARQAQQEQEALAQALQANAAAMAAASVEDPLNGPPRDTPRAMGQSASAGDLTAKVARPIDVFEQRKRQTMRRRADGEDMTTLDLWMDGQSVSSHTTAATHSTQMTRFSQLTRTSDGGSSICSEPGTTNQLAYRIHKRAAAANKRRFMAGDQHSAGNLKDGIPSIGFPDSERHATQYKDAYGDTANEGAHVFPQMYQSVLRDNSHPFVQKFLETAAPDQKDQFAGMVRSLEYLRKAHWSQHQSVLKEHMDLGENQRLWKPPRQRPVFDTSEINISKVPLGNLAQGKPGAMQAGGPPPPTHPPPEAAAMRSRPSPPPSPSVSGLGSLPLSRLSTPAVL